MIESAFTAQRRQEWFHEVLTVERAPKDEMSEHTHPFEAKALILDGEITILSSGESRIYRRGDIFHLGPNQVHSEVYGPQGVTYVVGRK